MIVKDKEGILCIFIYFQIINFSWNEFFTKDLALNNWINRYKSESFAKMLNLSI